MSTPLHAESTISKLVDALLPRGSSKENPWDEGPSKALYMCLHLRSHVYSDDEEFGGSKWVHLIFERPTNYTKVWSVVTDNCLPLPKPEEFTMKSNHDSCWRVDGLRDVLRAHAELVHNAKKGAGPTTKHSDVRSFNHINDIHYVEVTYEQNPDRHHDKNLTNIRWSVPK